MTEQKAKNPIVAIKDFGNNPAIMARFKEVLKDRAPQFMADVVNVVRESYELQKCDPNSVWGAAMIAASLDLSVNKNLGFAGLVPYKDKCQFQIMAKGFKQLAIRSGQYADLGDSEIYADEVKAYDPITGHIEFTPVEGRKDRDSGDENKIVGYYSWFELKTGFKKSIYMTVGQVKAHAKKFSNTYRNGLNDTEKRKTPWWTNFHAMAKKTVTKALISGFGILSIEMRQAIEADQAAINAETGEMEYIDNKQDAIVAKPVVED